MSLQLGLLPDEVEENSLSEIVREYFSDRESTPHYLSIYASKKLLFSECLIPAYTAQRDVNGVKNGVKHWLIQSINSHFRGNIHKKSKPTETEIVAIANRIVEQLQAWTDGVESINQILTCGTSQTRTEFIYHATEDFKTVMKRVSKKQLIAFCLARGLEHITTAFPDDIMNEEDQILLTEILKNLAKNNPTPASAS